MQKRMLHRIIAGTTAALLLFSPTVALAAPGGDLQTQLGATQDKITQAKAKLSAGKAHQDELVRQIQGMEEQIAGVDERLTELKDELDRKVAARSRAEVRLDALNRDIPRAAGELEAAKTQLARETSVLNGRIKRVYKMGKLPFYAVLLKSADFWDFINRASLLARIGEQDAKMVKQIQAAKASVEEKQYILAAEKRAVEAERATVAADTERVAQLRSVRETESAALRADQAEKQSLIGELRDEQMTMLASVQKDEATANDVAAQIEAEKARAAEEALNGSTGDGGNSSPSHPSSSRGGSPSSVHSAIEAECARQSISPEPVKIIVDRESGDDPYAVNHSSGAAGLFQRVPGDGVTLGDIDGQVRDGVSYIRIRYGSSEAALAWWNAFGWY